VPETKFFSIDELGEMPPPRWLIHEMFEANSLVMVAGPPGSFKSFLVLDWLLCMASGRDWLGKKTEKSRVLYVLGEGRSSLLKRIQVWIYHNRLNDEERRTLNENFKVTFDVPQMATRSSVDNMLMGLHALNFSPQVITIDTFARSFVGMDENTQKDVGLWVDSADRLRALGYTVIFLHHTAKNTEFGVKYRGSTAILGAMDTAMTLVRDPDIPDGVKLTVTKQKDHDEGDPMYFSRLVINPPGMPDGSMVLVKTLKMDERFTEKGKDLEKVVDELIVNDRFLSDRSRAMEITRQFPDISLQAAQKRISRKRQEMDGLLVGSEPSSVTHVTPF
jgi:hypothetical protein